jgi:hypothetical protein
MVMIPKAISAYQKATVLTKIKICLEAREAAGRQDRQVSKFQLLNLETQVLLSFSG